MHRVAVCILSAAALFAQPPARIAPGLRFEVASLKPSAGSANGFYGIRPAPGGQRYEATNCPIRMRIQVAYRVKPEQIVGGPAWIETDGYDMEAKAERPSTADELHVMLMNLLVDRLQLKFHQEKKEMGMYALVRGKGEIKMTPHEAANAGEPWIDVNQEKFLHMKLKATSVPMDYVAYRLSLLMDRPVVDMTGIKGGYDFELAYTRELPLNFPPGAKLNGEEPDTSGPTIFEAVRQQLGLELKAQKGPVDVIVIDHVEKPAAN